VQWGGGAFIRTLKEQSIDLQQFDSLEQARRIIGEFNSEWLIERLGHRAHPTAIA
jgi:hypothetical protein